MERKNWESMINDIVKDFMSLEKGEILKHEFLERRYGIERTSSEYLYVVSRARQELIRAGIITKTIMYLGYKILNENEIADYVYDKFLMSSMKKQESALEIIKYVDKDKLNHDELMQLKGLEKLILNVNSYSINEIVKSQLQLGKAQAKLLGE